MESKDDFLCFICFFGCGGESFMNYFYLPGMYAAHAVEAEGFGIQNILPQSFHIAYVGEHRIDRLNAGGPGCIHDHAACKKRFFALQCATGAEVGGVILQAYGQRDYVIRRRSNRISIDDPESAFDDGHDPDLGDR